MFAIAIYDPNMNGDKYVSKNGVDYTVHAEKVQAFTWDNALFALRQWFPGHKIIPLRDAKF